MDRTHHLHPVAAPCQAEAEEGLEVYQSSHGYFAEAGWAGEVELPAEQQLEEEAEAGGFPGDFVGIGVTGRQLWHPRQSLSRVHGIAEHP